MYQAVKRFWEKLDENSKSDCDWVERPTRIRRLSFRRSKSVQSSVDIIKNSLPLGSLTKPEENIVCSGKDEVVLKHSKSTEGVPDESNHNKKSRSGRSTRGLSLPSELDYLTLHQDLDAAILEIDKMCVLSDSSSEDEEEEIEENKNHEPLGDREQGALMLYRYGVGYSSTFSLHTPEGTDRLSGTLAGQLSDKFHLEIDLVLSKIFAMEDGEKKIQLIKEVQMYIARLRADVMLNNHFAILATVLDPIKEEIHQELSAEKKEL
ncbi:uncharacterized protein LOC111715677 isoform X2 [Eurytemora carolleeae]|uniref:uncharacterized protein LOC111715677 isoform X2 n=1 Tax=Eurytemora carolleeae TaxID=1294199 RepID=UPI000C784750|nr:uncharacterized protein LOC111715677 isoform X2 [Eurytemora carolleeae]|eukprot:XP_023346803.1 uncharacterized protein LOC111715677 isoform X2 [Eurytemora affinis]